MQKKRNVSRIRSKKWQTAGCLSRFGMTCGRKVYARLMRCIEDHLVGEFYDLWLMFFNRDRSGGVDRAGHAGPMGFSRVRFFGGGAGRYAV